MLTENVAVNCPAATVTDAGTVAAEGLLLISVTAIPPVGAGPFSVTVPIELSPPVTDVGFRLSEVTDRGLIARVAVLVAVPREAVIVAVTAVATEVVLIVKVALVAPAGTVTVAGVVALALLDDTLMTVPPVGAGPPSVTVPVADRLPTNVVGETVSPVKPAELTVRVAVFVTVPSTPLMVAVVEFATADVVMVNVAEVAPAATVTLDGTTALELLEVKLTTSPPVGAGPLKVNVPVDELPPWSEVGERVNPVRPGGVMVRVVFTDVEPSVAVMVAVADVATTEVVIVNVPVEAPAAMVTVDGTTALELLEVKFTTVPPAGAALFKVTVPVEGVPPSTDVGETDTAVGTRGVKVSDAVRTVFP